MSRNYYTFDKERLSFVIAKALFLKVQLEENYPNIPFSFLIEKICDIFIQEKIYSEVDRLHLKKLITAYIKWFEEEISFSDFINGLKEIAEENPDFFK